MPASRARTGHRRDVGVGNWAQRERVRHLRSGGTASWAVPGADRLVNVYMFTATGREARRRARRSRTSVRSTPRRRSSREWPPPANCRCNSPTATTRRLHRRKWSRQFLPRPDGGHGARPRLPSRRGRPFVPPGGGRHQPPHMAASFRRRRTDRGQACAARQRALHSCRGCAGGLRRNGRQRGRGLGAVCPLHLLRPLD